VINFKSFDCGLLLTVQSYKIFNVVYGHYVSVASHGNNTVYGL
jgi:hypothetical protein